MLQLLDPERNRRHAALRDGGFGALPGGSQLGSADQREHEQSNYHPSEARDIVICREMEVTGGQTP